MLHAKNITYQIGAKNILNVDQIKIEAGEIVGLIGPNGSGKTSLLRALLGMETQCKGECNLWKMTAKSRSQYAGWLAQDRDISWDLSVAEIVALGRLPWQGAFGRAHINDRLAIKSAADAMGIDAFMDRNIASLSGGERARVLIARLLAQQTKLIFADEPIAALDPAHQLQTMSLFAQRARAGQAVFVSIHDLGMAARFCDRLVLLHEGEIKAIGDAKTVLSDINLEKYFSITAYKTQYNDQLIVQPLEPIDAE